MRVSEAEYDAYLLRAERVMGEVPVGGYSKVKGRLVKKLSYEEFVERWESFSALRTSYEESMAEGDTVNDAVVQLLEEAAAELLIRL
jgi:hypothetical protein